MHRRRFIAAAGVAGVPGCLRLQSGDDTPTSAPTDAGGTPTATTTPTSTPTATATPTEAVDYPTGMSAEGVEPLLAGAHASALLGTSYTLEFLMENVSQASRFEDVTVEAVGREGLVSETHRRTPVERLFREDRRWWRATHEGDTVFGRNSLGVSVDALTRRRTLRVLFDAGDFGPPEPVQRDGQRRLRSTADGVADDGPLREMFDRKDVTAVESFEATVVADGDGVVRELTAEVGLVWDDRLNLVRFEYTTGAIGSTPRPEPGWLSTAREQAPRVTVDLAGDGRVVVATNEGPGTVPSGARAILHPAGSYASTDRELLDAELGAGESLWLWREGGETQVARSAPADGAPAALDGRFITSLDIGVANYARRQLG